MSCVIAGGGPAGAMLGLLLARSGVKVTLLEKHADFLRDFRGDTIHPSTMQVLDEVGLIDDFLALPHRKTRRLILMTDDGMRELTRLSGLRSRYDYIAMVPQWDFLDLVTGAAKRHPGFEMIMNAEAYDLIREDGAVRGLRYRDPTGEHEIRAALTVAADGRNSTLREVAGLPVRNLGAPIDVLWFRLPRAAADTEETFLRVAAGYFVVAINRETYWQMACVIPKGGLADLRARGIDAFREPLRRLLPFLDDRLAAIEGYDQLSMLTVKVDHLERWHLPGFLCIGDAAHAMSPVFGVGINLAVQDAVATANLLAGSLRSGAPIPESTLHLLQKRRMFPTKATQAAQRFVQERLLRPTLGLDGGKPPRVPTGITRIPVLSGALRRFVGFGIRPEHVTTRASS
ncbi:FAD-dependent oxidoreductase [Nonomuraea typhae]|uniref:FAD-dependent oxidoreductase n=1 Tax=Nonomuraea typhae TaxID=2603600 RepID=UPI0012FBB4C6|nr:FAD-dependent oxidoreductase [Nonomuraea typhae]